MSAAENIHGERFSGEDVRTQNVAAVQAIANIVKSSLGPVGLDKMLVDDIGDVTITNDGATILKQLEVEHPAAKILVELAELQDSEVGDGTTSVVILAAELLKRANELARQKIHPTSIIGGFRMAVREACKYLKEKLAIKTDALGKDCIINAAKTSMSSKIIGSDSDFFSNLCVESMLAVKTIDENGSVKYPVKAVNILKAHGKSLKESQLIKGYALNVGRAAQGMPKVVSKCKVACLDMNLQKTRMQMGIQILVTDPKELEKIREEELNITRNRIKMLLDAGANVILTTKGIDDMTLKYFVEAGAIAARRVAKDDIRRIAKATGAQVLMSFSDMDGNESIDSSMLGDAEEIAEERVADDDILVIRGAKSARGVTILLRGANDFMLDEIDRSVHDALCVVKRVLESPSVVPGGGAVEAALAVFLEIFATTLGSREQLAIAEFSEALLVIPKVLAVNAAKDATELVAKLRAYHYAAQVNPAKAAYAQYGLDLSNGVVRDNAASGILEPAVAKLKILQFATEAAITILRIDDMIKLKKEEEEE